MAKEKIRIKYITQCEDFIIMNARSYRVKINLSPLDFPAIIGLGEQSDITVTDVPVIIEGKLVLNITKKIMIIETYTDKKHEVFTSQSIYEIPLSRIKTSDDIYEFYKDSTSGMKEAYQYARKRMPFPDLEFPIPPIETYQKEIDGIFYLLNSQN